MNKLIGLIFLVVLGSITYFFVNLSLPHEAVTVVAKPTVTVTPTPLPTHLSAEKLTALVNEWRVSQGYQPYIENEDLCSIARDRADEGADNHKGFMNKYSSYPSIIQENLAVTDTEENMLIGWLNSPSHRATLEKSYKYSCIACYKNQCNQIFSNLENGTYKAVKSATTTQVIAPTQIPQPTYQPINHQSLSYDEPKQNCVNSEGINFGMLTFSECYLAKDKYYYEKFIQSLNNNANNTQNSIKNMQNITNVTYAPVPTQSVNGNIYTNPTPTSSVPYGFSN